VIFDLDGTLIDTPRAILETMRVAAQRPDADEGVVRAAIGLPLEVALARVLGLSVDASEVVKATERYRALWRAEVGPRLAGLVFPGVREGLATLRERGLSLGVATGKTQAGADHSIDEAGLRALLDHIAGHDRAARPKPHGDLALFVLRALSLQADEAVVVGDSALDLQMAHAAGVRSIAVTYGAQSEDDLRAAAPTWVARSFPEVVTLLGTL
jgi:phosphoglycolate phosphatase-like HAD superfamily hydrolase